MRIRSILLLMLLLPVCSQAAVFTHQVNPVGIGIHTTSSLDGFWNQGDKRILRLSGLFPESTCSANVLWFPSNHDQLFTLALSAIATGKNITVSVRDDTRVAGYICEVVFLEIKP